MECFWLNIALECMDLQQIVVVYDQAVMMFQCLQLHQSADVFQQELQHQKLNRVIFAINKNQQLSIVTAIHVIKCYVLRAVTTLQHARRMIHLLNVLTAVKALFKTLSIYLNRRMFEFVLLTI